MKFQEAIYCKSCGIIIKNSSLKQPKRAYCKYCYKQETKEIWEWKKDIENDRRRPLRRLEQTSKTCICCGKEFETARKQQVTCGSDECQKMMKNIKAKIKRKNKTVTKVNTK